MESQPTEKILNETLERLKKLDENLRNTPKKRLEQLGTEQPRAEKKQTNQTPDDPRDR